MNREFTEVATLLEQNGHSQILCLKIQMTSDDNDIYQKYKNLIDKHNQKLLDEPKYVDAGFDLLSIFNEDICVQKGEQLTMTYPIKCSAKMYMISIDDERTLKYSSYNTGFCMYPRSSLSKTNLRLANCVGIIDSGYRGNLIGKFDVIEKTVFRTDETPRFLQICSPTLCPIFVKLSSRVSDDRTSRGDGGFGSTGV
tara:strand:+ start:415 stop:1005 length:591 start_codon:yes stop_codon:yes gene_type:complete